MTKLDYGALVAVFVAAKVDHLRLLFGRWPTSGEAVAYLMRESGCCERTAYRWLSEYRAEYGGSVRHG